MFKGQSLISLSVVIWLTSSSSIKAESLTYKIILVQETIEQVQTKRELIKQLLELTSSRQIWEQSLELNFTQIEQNFSTLLPQLYGSSELSSQDQQNLEVIKGKVVEIMTKFKAQIKDNLTYDEILENVYYPLYEKYFTEQELIDILAFYKTPTGQRTLEVMPQLLQESIQKINELMLPKMIPVLQEIIQEEMRSIESRT